MNPVRPFFPAAVAVFCLIVPSAIAQKVSIDYDRKADFSKVRQYQWRTHPVFEKHPELKEVYATGIQLVMEEGNAQLMNKGLQPADGEPDVYITFFLKAEGGQAVRYIDYGPWFGAGYGWYNSPAWTTIEVENYLQGMLVIDIVDARTSKLLWRAICGDKITEMRERDKNISKTVKKALDRFPPINK